MLAKVVKVEQGTDAWEALRRCRITASRVGDVMAKKGTKAHDNYQRQLILELLGHTETEKTPEWFRHGREMEPRALAHYEWKYDEAIDHNVFLIHKDYDWIGCSPDGLITVNGIYTGGLEIKCRKLFTNYRAAIERTRVAHVAGNLLNAIEPVYRWQVQTCMWLTGFDHWYICNYYEDAQGRWRMGRCPIPRDDKLISLIEERSLEFMHECYEYAQAA